MRICLECEKRETCTELCRDMKKELKNVEVYQRETQHIVIPDDKDPHDDDKIVRKMVKQKEGFYRDIVTGDAIQNIELIYYLNKQGKKPSEIAYHLPCSVQYIRRVINLLGKLKKSYKHPKRLIKEVYRVSKSTRVRGKNKK